ncbi:Prosaposin [Holothuria leucospilota]|uniref:Prosaposin n=1 Tax=Holothuria leucospilota TaxID=206669 RepID=A0A9Q0YMM9_HOLLE|nr:Prosaposin [Holothuria leucospilota]
MRIRRLWELKMKYLLVITLALVAQAYGMRKGPRVGLTTEDHMYAVQGNLKCDLCEMFVKDLKEVIESKEDEITNAVETVCGEIPSSWDINCTQLVEEYLPYVFMLLDQLTEQEICELMQLCDDTECITPPPKAQRTFVRMVKHYLRRGSMKAHIQKRRIRFLRSHVDDDYQCTLCKDAVGFLHDRLVCNRTWSMLTEELKQICPFLPNVDECNAFFDSLPGEIQALADEYLDEEKDCQYVGLCPQEEEEAEEEHEEGDAEMEEDLRRVIESTERLERNLLAKYKRRQEAEQDGGNVDDAWSRRGQRSKEEFIADLKRKWYRMREIPAEDAAHEWSKIKKNRALVRMGRRMRRSVDVVLGENFEEVDEVPYGIENIVNVPNNVQCEVCEGVTRVVQEELQRHSAELLEKLKIYFTDFCEVLGESWQSRCMEEVAEEVPAILVELLTGLFGSDILCTDVLRVCVEDTMIEE